MFTSRQLRAARALLGWEQAELSVAAQLSVQTVKRMESSQGPVRGNARTIYAVQRALESAGVQFIDQNGGGPGVRGPGE